MEEGRRPLNQQVIARTVRLNGIRPDRLKVDLHARDQERANRYRFPEDRLRFLAGRALLAQIIKEVAETKLKIPDLVINARGRPVFPHDSALQFSISHAGDFIAVALAVGTRVGIDVEKTSRELDFNGLAGRIFSEDDLQDFLAQPADARAAAFFRAWTAKEAILKARGVGLAGGLKEVSVRWQGKETPAVKVAVEGDGASWCLRALPFPVGYLAHVAWDDGGRDLDFREVRLDEMP